MTTTRERVYRALDTERDYQKYLAKKAGVNAYKVRPHSLEDFVLYMEDYMHELRHQLSRIWTRDRNPTTEMLNTLRKVTALGVAAMEQHGAPYRDFNE